MLFSSYIKIHHTTFDFHFIFNREVVETLRHTHTHTHIRVTQQRVLCFETERDDM